MPISSICSSWFNRGFRASSHRLVDASDRAGKIIRYEAVHDPRLGRFAPAHRSAGSPLLRVLSSALVDDPLIFVEVAVEREIPAPSRRSCQRRQQFVEPDKARIAVFYSISNCQRGLTGVSFGNFLIKQVVEEICRELPKLTTFVTLSPVPGFARWLAGELKDENSSAINAGDRITFECSIGRIGGPIQKSSASLKGR
jgi:malonyl-CoA decarboxylase